MVYMPESLKLKAESLQLASQISKLAISVLHFAFIIRRLAFSFYLFHSNSMIFSIEFLHQWLQKWDVAGVQV
jgi:hypothetical protein